MGVVIPGVTGAGHRLRTACQPQKAKDTKCDFCLCHADIRRQLWEYDQVLNTQRDKVYLERRKALLAKDLCPLVSEYAERTVDDILEVRLRAPSGISLLILCLEAAYGSSLNCE